MNHRYSNIFLIVVTTAALSVLGLQLLFSINHYHEKKWMLLHEIDIALNNALDTYYYEDAKEEFITVVDKVSDRSFKEFAETISITSIQDKSRDSVLVVQDHKSFKRPISSYEIYKGKAKADSIINLSNKGNTLYLPIKKNTLDLEKLNNRLKDELSKRSILMDYNLVFKAKDSLPVYLNGEHKTTFLDSIQANNVFLPESSTFHLLYVIPAKLVIKKGAYQIALSFLLSLFILACIAYLLKTLQVHKKNIEIRNDFVSNISHEFKTPIAIVSSALEAIKDFNADGNKEKQNKYLSIAQENVLQLNTLTEKILETTTMENEKLKLQLRSVNISQWLEKIIEKYRNTYPHKDISFTDKCYNPLADIDAFYFGTALNNIMDNAIKYGGQNIAIHLNSTKKEMTIEVTDDGIGINKIETARIFEKYYRIPTGNIHRVRGYGLGLYYAHKIVESHGGTLKLLTGHPPLFKITLPYE